MDVAGVRLPLFSRNDEASDRGCDPPVAISLSVVVLLAIIMVVLVRGKSLKVGPAIVAALFGFFLASTGMAPAINKFLDSLADTINQINL